MGSGNVLTLNSPSSDVGEMNTDESAPCLEAQATTRQSLVEAVRNAKIAEGCKS
eukprot:CAMPEP_0170440642 /NCGR_PEP_ID=MMETSP0117_2-20130122/46445_1 /TAXON_ID=400756 /ORGANISM="Durinskia baltica, Strain CSIRO CS-38" /LENGTH=53 /DNA_ID=CAMNT_0010701081 /DNA_START=44 /DNA_END=205 /DNA_ORIENTATION=-